eukprot:2643380-Lingulodinium_polyedra.AAC.1
MLFVAVGGDGFAALAPMLLAPLATVLTRCCWRDAAAAAWATRRTLHDAADVAHGATLLATGRGGADATLLTPSLLIR